MTRKVLVATNPNAILAALFKSPKSAKDGGAARKNIGGDKNDVTFNDVILPVAWLPYLWHGGNHQQKI